MTVTQLIEALGRLPGEAVVLMANDDGLAMVDAIDFVEALGPGQPAEAILLPQNEE
jgi:hypothetical protein